MWNFEKWVTSVFGAVLGLILAVLAIGCAPNALPKEFVAFASVMAEQIKDQGILDEWAQRWAAEGVEPGFEFYTGIEFVGGARLPGVAGRAVIEASGDGTQLPANTREALIQQLDQPISDDQRSAILKILGWNRAQSTPPSG